MSRLIVLPTLIVAFTPVFVNTSTAAIDDDLQTVYSAEDAKWFIDHKVPFKIASEAEWTNHDQKALAYAYKSNLNSMQLKLDYEYNSVLLHDSREARIQNIEQEKSILKKHNIARAKILEKQWLRDYESGHINDKQATDPFLGEIAAHKKDWMDDTALFKAVNQYTFVVNTGAWDINTCRQLEADFDSFKKRVLDRPRYFLWKKKHDIFYYSDQDQISQITVIKKVQTSLASFMKTIDRSDIEMPRAYPELAAFHENDWHECRRILNHDMPAKYKALASTLDTMMKSIYSKRILTMAQNPKSNRSGITPSYQEIRDRLFHAMQ